MGGATTAVEGSVSSWASVFNVGNCAIGAGVLSFPYAFGCSGLLGGVVMCLVVAGVELFTLRLLMRQSSKHTSMTYQGLVRQGLGQAPAEFMSWTIFLYLFGSCVAYLIIVGDTFGHVMQQYVIQPNHWPDWLADRRTMVILPAITIILPLSLQRSMGALAPTSSAAVIVMLFTTVVVVYKAAAVLLANLDATGSLLPAGVALFKWDLSTFSALPVMVFAYHCHVQAVPIFYELTHEPSLCPCAPRPPPAEADGGPVESAALRRLRGMYDVLATAYAECTVMYLLVGACGYVMFPGHTASNILNNFAPDDALMQFVRFVVGWAVVFHYPINQHVARTAMYDLLCKYAGVQPKRNVPYVHLASLTLAFFVAATATACVVSDLGIVFQIMGGVSGSLLIFVLPGALLVRRRSPALLMEVEPGEDVALLPSEPLLPAAAASSRSHYTRPYEQTALDTPLMGWLLLVTGALVIALTLYTTFAQLHAGAESASKTLRAAAGIAGDSQWDLRWWTADFAG